MQIEYWDKQTGQKVIQEVNPLGDSLTVRVPGVEKGDGSRASVRVEVNSDAVQAYDEAGQLLTFNMFSDLIAELDREE